MDNDRKIDISVIVPIVERHDDLNKLYDEFAKEFARLGKSYEFIFVVDGKFDQAFSTLQKIKSNQPDVKIIKLIKNFGESIALSVGVAIASGEYIYTLAPYFQVGTESVALIWKELQDGYDLVITRRFPRIDSKINQIQSSLFHWLIRRITSIHFHDISCGLKGMKRKVFDEVKLYGDLHRFIPILADHKGFKIKEINASQRKEDSGIRLVTPGVYSRRILDILTIFFITKFTMKPLRFFGLIGFILGGIGSVITGYLGAYRLLGLGGIADRPLLFLGVLLIVLGIQTLSIGLIGEIIIFTHARELKEYSVDEYLDSETKIN